MPYPDNMPSAYRSHREYCCMNDECSQRPWPVRGKIDIGEFFADDEEDTICPTCGKEGE